MKNILASVSLIALLASPALAQTGKTDTMRTPAPADKMAPAGTTTPAAKPGDMRTDMNKDKMHATAGMGEWRASKLIGANVYSANNEDVGEINELIVDNSGKIAKVVIGVGGFLGLGERDVAVNFDELRYAHDGSAIKITSSFTKDTLTKLPAWSAKDYDAARTAK
ncbi:MAG: PRC-barrel domain-containing protein [Beijerinckiaceae bacterium]